MGGFRARDADRDHYVELIEAAYADGQLGEQDRELRVSRALTAETLDELDALTRDLQNQPAPVVVHPTPAQTGVAPARAPAASAKRAPWPVTSTDRGPLGVLGVVAAGIFALVVFGMATSAPSQEGFDHSRPPDTGSVPAAGYELSQSKVLAFVRRYEARFGTGDTHGVTFFPDRVSAEVPGRGTRGRSQVWIWDGDWRRDKAAEREDAPAEVVDLGALDVWTLFRNVDVAKADLGVSDARLARIQVRPAPEGEGTVVIHVRNGFTHTAQLETTTQGSRVRAVPHEE